jgi:hypothetical protein
VTELIAGSTSKASIESSSTDTKHVLHIGNPITTVIFSKTKQNKHNMSNHKGSKKLLYLRYAGVSPSNLLMLMTNLREYIRAKQQGSFLVFFFEI